MIIVFVFLAVSPDERHLAGNSDLKGCVTSYSVDENALDDGIDAVTSVDDVREEPNTPIYECEIPQGGINEATIEMMAKSLLCRTNILIVELKQFAALLESMYTSRILIAFIINAFYSI